MTIRARMSCGLVAAAVAAIALGSGAVAPASAQERAYELVTPPGVDANVRFGAGVAASDGNFVCYQSESSYLGAFSTGLVLGDIGYCARRTSTGWQGEWATGPKPSGLIHPGPGAQVYYVSPDGSRVVFATGNGIFRDWEPETGVSYVPIVSAHMREAGVTRWLAPTTNPPANEGNTNGGGTGDRGPLAASEDLRHGIFNSALGLVPQDTNDMYDVYEWTPDGIRLVSSDAAGTAVGGLPPLAQVGVDAKRALPGTMSRDGSRIFFISRAAIEGAPGGDVFSVFMRKGDELSHVSPRRGPGPAVDVRFAGATADGGVVYLTTEEQLTSEPKEAGVALYRYDVATDELTLVATDPNGIEFLDLSEDGSTIVYTTGEPATPPVIVRRGGVDSVLGLADRAADAQSLVAWGGVISNRPDKRGLRISADGSVVVFGSAGDFGLAPPGTTHVYRWEPGRGLAVLDVDERGTVASGTSRIGNYSIGFPLNPLELFRQSSFLSFMRANPNLGRVMSADGRRVFFETTERLLPGDVNDVIDVYEWHDGRVQLISPGAQTEHAYYHDSSTDGSTVFFTTTSRLIPELDRNASADVYAARIGGGFPLPDPVPTCASDGCQGGTPTPPETPRPASDVFEGPGDSADPAPPVARFSVLRFDRRQIRALARSGRTVVRVRATVPGTIRVVASARMGRRSRRVASGREALLRAGVAKIQLRLSRRARLQLRDAGKLRVTIGVAYSEVERTISRRVMLRG